jgi:hypothetical protein
LTDADGVTQADAGPEAMFTVEAIWALVELVEALRGRDLTRPGVNSRGQLAQRRISRRLLRLDRHQDDLRATAAEGETDVIAG